MCKHTQTQDGLTLSDYTAWSDFAATIVPYTTHAHFALCLSLRHSLQTMGLKHLLPNSRLLAVLYERCCFYRTQNIYCSLQKRNS